MCVYIVLMFVYVSKFFMSVSYVVILFGVDSVVYVSRFGVIDYVYFVVSCVGVGF